MIKKIILIPITLLIAFGIYKIIELLIIWLA